MWRIRKFFSQLASLFTRRTIQTDDPQGKGQRLVVVITAVVFTLVLCLGWAYVVWQDYRSAFNSAKQDANNFALALDEHAQRSFDSALQMLERIADRIEDKDMRTWAASRSGWEVAKSLVHGIPQVNYILLIDEKGAMRMHTSEFPSPSINVRDRDYFLAHAEHNQSRFLGPLIIGRGTGQPAFTLSLRLLDKQGKFRGVVLASMNIGYFRNFYRSLDLDSSGTVVLLRDDGKLLVREPMSASMASMDISNHPLYTHYLKHSSAGNLISPSPFDGKERLVAYRQGKDFPFVVIASRSLSSIREPVLKRALLSGAGVVTFLLVIWGVVYIQFRSIERESQARQELEANHDFAESILDSVNSHIAILDEHGNIIRTNQAWRNFGLAIGLRDDGIGMNYLEVCRRSGTADSQIAEEAASGIASVILGARESFRMEFSCRFPGDQQWIELNVTPLRGKKGHVVLAYENINQLKLVEEQLRRLATTDVLTGLKNRRSLVEIGEAEFARARRYLQDLAVIMLDCDRFKNINDQYGHAVGDQVLVALANQIKASIRETDHAGRFGGEEFVIVLPHTPQEGAVALAERMRESIEISPVIIQGTEIRYTVSLGVSFMTPDTESFGAMLNAADHALYRAKNSGRNQVQISPGLASTKLALSAN